MSAVLESPRETTRKNIPWVYLSTFSFFLAGAVFYLSLARLLSPDQLGTVVVVLAVVTLVSAVFSLGLGQGFQHFLSYYLGRREGATLRTLVRSGLLAALVLALAAGATTYLLAPVLSSAFLHDSAYTGLIQSVSLYGALLTAGTLLQSVLLGLQRFVLYSALSVVNNVAIYGFPFLFLRDRVGVDSVIMGWTVGAALGFALYFVAVIRDIWTRPGTPTGPPSLRGAELYRTVLTYSLPLFAASVIATGATYIDRLILATLSNLSSVGVYNYAILVGTGSVIVVAPFATILIPKISEQFGRGDRAAIRGTVRTAISLIVLLYAPIALALAAIGPVLLRYLVGPSFVPAAGPMAVLVIVGAVAIPYSVLSSLAAGVRRTGALVYASLFAIGANAALSFLLVPRLGMIGAAAGNSSMTWGIALVLLLVLRDTGLVEFDRAALARIWVSSAVLGAVVGVPLYLLDDPAWLVPPLLLVGLGVLLVLLRYTRAVSGEVRDFLEEMLPHPLGFVRPVLRWVAPTVAPTTAIGLPSSLAAPAGATEPPVRGGEDPDGSAVRTLPADSDALGPGGRPARAANVRGDAGSASTDPPPLPRAR